MYDRTSNLSCVNEAREEIFVKRIIPWRKYHPHNLVYPAGIWTTCTQEQPEIPSSEEYGWIMESGHWVPVLITLPEHVVNSLNLLARVRYFKSNLDVHLSVLASATLTLTS